MTKFNFSRPHSTYDHRRTCAVIGCKNKALNGAFCRKHFADPLILKEAEAQIKS